MIKKKKREEFKPVKIKEKDDKVKTIGKYCAETKLFKCERVKSEHFMRKHNAWGLDAKVVEYLVQERAEILLKDKETKWEYKAKATDFKLHGILEEYNQHRPQYFLPLDYWEIVKGNNRSLVIQCEEVDCKHNFGKQCMKGTITINSNGECASYEDKMRY